MSFWPVPELMKRDIYQIPPRVFTNSGIRFIMLDVDNTIAPYTENIASPQLVEWVGELKAAGLEVFILSNNKGERPNIFASALDIDYINKAKKPFTKKAREILRQRGYSPEETALIGDQIYTDALCAKRLGAMAVVVEPILFSNIFLRLRYWLEFPFRAKYKWNKWRKRNEY